LIVFIVCNYFALQLILTSEVTYSTCTLSFDIHVEASAEVRRWIRGMRAGDGVREYQEDEVERRELEFPQILNPSSRTWLLTKTTTATTHPS
jgi:hypothetical protein